MSSKQRRMLMRIALAAALFALGFLLPVSDVWKLLLYLLPYALLAYDVLYKAGRNILHGEVFDENFLMSIASIGAFVIGDYPEAVAVMLFYQIGELFQSVAVGRSRRSISQLMQIRPDHANVLREGAESEVPPEDVSCGETIVVRPGERIPLDGVIISGHTSVDASALTGESLPRDCGVGENVISGSINLGAVIHVKTSGTYGESTVNRILALVESASEKKTRSEAFITRFARWYTPCVVVAAALLATLPPLILGQAWSVWVNRALIFLVVSCPCALVISVPLSFFGGVGGIARRGVLIKGASDLETLSRVKTVVFDKTGTLTQGTFAVSAVHPQDMPESDLLDIAALAESYSTHPIASSILRAHGGHIDQSRVSDVKETAGCGVSAIIDGRLVYAGNDTLMERMGIAWQPCELSGTIVHVALDGVYCGHIVISDQIKPEASEAIAALRAVGVKRIVMLTGDRKSVGEAVAKELRIDEAFTELLPDQKVRITEELLLQRSAKEALAFVGDGVNDAPVLARADVGVAMGALGSDAAIEAADVVLMDDNPAKIALAIRASRRTMRIVRQNIVFALAVKALVLLLGALGFAGMWFAVFADVGVSVLAILNAMRALRVR